MCYILYVASPLTLSEIRSMLPAGITAHGLSPDDERRLRRDFRPARTVASLLIGPCSCDLVLDRDPAEHLEERELRARFAGFRMPRAEVIRALDAHRGRGDAEPAEPAARWRRILAAFVAEHARNAGPTVFWLRFARGGAAESPPDPPRPEPVTVAEVCAAPDAWLSEGVPRLVIR